LFADRNINDFRNCKHLYSFSKSIISAYIGISKSQLICHPPFSYLCRPKKLKMSAKQNSGRLPGERRPRIPGEAKRAEIEASKKQQSERPRRNTRSGDERPMEDSRPKPGRKSGFGGERAAGNRSERPAGKRFSSSGETGYSAERPAGKRTERPAGKPYSSSGKSGYSTDRPAGKRTDRPAGKPFSSSGRTGGRPKTEGYGNTDERAAQKQYGRFNKTTGPRPSRPETDERRTDSPTGKRERKFGDRPSGNRFGKSGGFGGPKNRPSKNKPLTEGMERRDKSGFIRLNKYLADAGICSRRDADKYIQAGVVKVNDQIVTELGSRVNVNDKVEFEGQVIRRERLRYVLLNKPKGYITTSDDPYERKTVMELVQGACEERIYPVGRLDRNTTGLLLLTNDGDLAKILTHPSHGASKLYHVWLDKPLTRNDLRKITEGVELEDGVVQVDAVDYVAEDESHKQVGIELHSGRNRVVRRLFEHLGYEVVKLDRAVFAGLTKLKLSRGHWRFLTPAEISMLKRIR
jgi:23S rRNA pseudouridine2605 synthase